MSSVCHFDLHLLGLAFRLFTTFAKLFSRLALSLALLLLPLLPSLHFFVKLAVLQLAHC